MSHQLDKILNSGGSYTFSSVVDGSEVFVISDLVSRHNSAVLYVALDDARMARLQNTLKFFAPEIEVLTFPAWDCIPYDRVSPNSSVVNQRIKTLSRLAKGVNKNCVIITTINSIVQKIVPKELFEKTSFSASVGDDINRDELSNFLVENGYINVGTSSEPGEFSLRGSIVDIFPAGKSNGFRLDFFDTRLETIRMFDPLTQISSDKVGRMEVVPASEIVMNENSIARFKKNYHSLFGAVLEDDPLYEAVSEGRKYAGMEHWLPLFYDNMDSLFDYLPDATIIFDHLCEEARGEREELIKDSYKTRQLIDNNTFSAGPVYNAIPAEKHYLIDGEWQSQIEGRTRAYIHPFEMPADKNIINFGYQKINNYASEAKIRQKSAFSILQEDISENDDISLIACVSEGSRSRMELMLDEYDIEVSKIDNWNERKKLRRNKKPGLIVLNIESGLRGNNIFLVSEQDILGEKIFISKTSRKRKTEKFLSEASNLMDGEIVVHRESGIGRFEGLEAVTVSGEAHDCLKLIYDGGDRLFVPVENIDLITRYGSEDQNTKLDKLGAASWQQRTAAIKNRIKVTADELLQVAAARELRKANIFHPESGSYGEFCSRFHYTETEDQERSIDDVLNDLTSGKPMDRLICGDVGFGKTEVALRAAFVAVHPEKGEEKGQVALISPTTLLCRQHFQTFMERFSGMNVTIRQLSRLVSSKESKETHKMIEDGSVDIVIGTHALLSENINFKNLSLLIVDEEQRFGVAQKEKLKKLRNNTHVLTLTATPIPRTLQLSLSGIRDLSLIATPPIDRLAVRTYVMPFDSVVIREAILREHYRGGRTFYVCPRIKDLEEIEDKIRNLVPEVRVVSAHGRMNADELDDIMQKFYDGKYDVLLSTTIVESGLDVPTANTLIVHKADMYGLAQLYQLRGRVGRSKVRAYAYLTLTPRKVPTKQAVKRLEVMQKLDTLGAGFSLASHDMDIRGFGNLLGDEQSGNIKEIGVELYQDMLREAIEEAKAANTGEVAVKHDFSPQINIGTSVLIPESYVSDLSLRLGLYRRIANLETSEEVESIAVELTDRFGKLPKEVENLLDVMKIKQVCSKLGIEKLDVGKTGAVFGFHNNYFPNPEALISFINDNNKTLKIRGDQKVVLKEQSWEKLDGRIKGINSYLNEISKLAS